MKAYQHLCTIWMGCLLLFSSVLSAQTTRNSSQAAADESILVEQLFDLTANNADITKTYVEKATFLQLNRTKLRKVYLERPSQLRLQIPQADGTLFEVDLQEVELFTDDFYVDDQDEDVKLYERGLYYHGHLTDDPKSLAAVSIFDNKVVGVFSSKGEKMILGHLKQDVFPAGDAYIFYQESDLLIENKSKCAADDLPIIDDKFDVKNEGNNTLNDCKIVEIYFEADYRMYLDNGSSEDETMDFVTAMFNVVALLYENENVITRLSKVRVWTSNDGYPTSSSTSALYAFRSRLGGQFDGDVAQLLSTVPNNNGGVAFVGVLCTPSYAVSYSNIRNSFTQFPTYSWTVMVVTHELGHNLGSPHTHSCSWPGGAIDGCYPQEGACSRGPAPSGGGTIMSYCHLTNYGINLQRGFGQLPGNLIRSKVNSASCLASSQEECDNDGDNGGGGDDDDDDDDDDDNGGGFGKPNLTKASDNLVTLGLNIQASVIVKNSGNGRSGPCQISFYLSTDNSFSTFSDYLVESKAIPRLQRGENFGVQVEADLSQADVAPGSYYLGYIIDSANEVEETTEGDNTWYWINPRFPLTGGGGGGGDDDDDDDDDDNDGDDDENAYCDSKGDDVKYEWIARVAVGDIDNESERDGGYGDYTRLSTDLERGSNPSVRLTPGFRRQQYREQWMIWIDFNKDMDFDDANELVFRGEQPTKEELTGRLKIPGDVPQGETRMRVSMKWFDEDDELQKACSTFGYGEVEDYTVNITGDASGFCEINSAVAADQSDCDPRTATYYQEIRISYSGNPDTILASIAGTIYPFVAEGGTQHIKIEDLPADGNPVDVKITLFSADGCEVSEEFARLFIAPEACEAVCEMPVPLGVSLNGNEFTIEWEENEFAEYYQLRYREAGEVEWMYQTSREGVYSTEDFIENSTYEYQIRTNCGDIGWSDWSEIYVFVTPGRCGIPSPRSVEIQTATKVNINWYPLPRASQYRIRWRAYNTEQWEIQTANGISIGLDDLMGGTTYEYQLSAKCGVSWAGWSAIYIFMTADGMLPGTGAGATAFNTADIKVYPNPANSWISVISNQQGTQQVNILDTKGKLLQQHLIYGNENSIDISRLLSGVYFIQIRNEAGENVTKRLVKY
ncbi:MAG: M12 family metallo-peptidase [Bacteroidota bacterium]